MKSKKLISVLILVTIIATIFSACSNPIEEIKFNEEEASVRLENTYQIEYTITPSDIENPKIKWSSSNKDVATVDESGLVTALAEGETTITATAKKDVYDELKVTVTPKICTETDEIKVEGLYVDNSYKDDEKSSNKLLYMYYTIKSPKSNVSIDSKSTTITINDNNEYESKRTQYRAEADKFSCNYYYSDYLRTVNVGETLKVMESFLIPSAELANGNTITFSNKNFESEKDLIMDASSIEYFKNGKELAKKADPKGYKTETDKRKKVSDSEARKVKNMMNGYYWSFYVSPMSYRIDFYSPNNFHISGSIGGSRINNDGTYEVRKGYIYLKYKNKSE
ncbi:MAG: Ig-like domain-containing protein, partial [Clostridia bacterium]|nr:Ig-like domain-containing protein [Clostridia bacterium]